MLVRLLAVLLQLLYKNKWQVASTLKLKNNGKHGAAGSSKYEITIKVNGDDVSVTGAWGTES
jgi:hypothetical protein